MPQVAVPHVIGTVILLGLLFVVILYSQNIQFSYFEDTTEVQLKDISGYVSSEIIAVADIATSTGGSQLIYKVLNIPKSVNGKGYSIEIVNKDGVYGVLAYLDEYPNIYGFTPLHFNVSRGICLNKTGLINIDSNTRIAILSRMYSGTKNALVWVKYNGSVIMFGLGRLERR